jgi:hypothetical protein
LVCRSDKKIRWKANATLEIAQLRSAVQRLLRHNGLSDIDMTTEEVLTQSAPLSTANPSPANAVVETGAAVVVPPMDMTRENSVERDSVEDSGLVTAPMRSLYDLTHIRNLRSSARWVLNSSSKSLDDDFIAQGVVEIAEAEDLFKRYHQHIRLYLWGGVLCPFDTLDAVRRSSTLLAAAVLTIAALHTPGRDEALEKCYTTFVSLSYSACLSRPQNLNDIRALALAAFYLSNLSWKLSGIAVRNAVEMNMHQSFPKLMRGHEDHRDNVRLWYVLYVCEHQFSIAYGRPPIIHQDTAIKNIERFLDSPLTKPGDIRLGAQVTLFEILTEAYTTYGSDPASPLSEADFDRLDAFNASLKQWRQTWQSRSHDSPSIGAYPSKGVVLYYHFARFQLNSLALRAMPSPTSAPPSNIPFFSPARRAAANTAISAATNTLTLLFDEPSLRLAMPAVPIFTHTMLAFAATFLLKMARTWGEASTTTTSTSTSTAGATATAMNTQGPTLVFNTPLIVDLARRAAVLLADVARELSAKHLTRHVVRGIEALLEQLDRRTPLPPPSSSLHPPPLPTAPAPASAQPYASASAAPAQAPDPTEAEAGAEAGAGVELYADADLAIDAANASGFSFHDLIGSYGFGFDEGFLSQVGAADLEFWSAEPF